LAPHFRYAPITFSRAFDELESAELAESVTAGRTRRLHLSATKKVVWMQAGPLLRNPVRRLHHVRGDMDVVQGLIAGLSALAQRSMIAEPANPVIAVSREQWKSVRQRKAIEPIPVREADATDVEVWAYPPHDLSGAGIVDPLSLHLSLREEADERIEAALEHMLEMLPW
jgi:hypothetical protein